jgi:outer membrane protein assembly factor BamE (lipoprotein component of BamABCDE complex)
MHHPTCLPSARRTVAILALVAIAGGGAGCATQINKHGHFIPDQDLAQVQPGMSQDAVKQLLGTPDTTSTIDGQVYYYISTTTEGYQFMSPSITDRRVAAVYFTPLGSVERVANYGLQDGQVIDFVSRTTPTATAEKGFLASLFRGIGKKKLNSGTPGP